MSIRRVVTGHSPEGKAVVASDEVVEPITLDLLPGYEFYRLWGTDEPMSYPDDGSSPSAHAYFPPVGGLRFGLFTVPPETTLAPDDIDVSAALAAMDEALPGMAAHMEPDSPGMHTTDTIDYEYVVSGECTLELDDGAEVTVRAGDTVVMSGTRHAWHNRTSEPCTMVVVLIGAHRA